METINSAARMGSSKFKGMAAVAALVTLAGTAQAAVVTIAGNRTEVSAGMRSGSLFASESVYPTTTGTTYSRLLDASVNAAFYSRNQIEHTVAAGVTTLSNQLTQRRGGTDYSDAQSKNSTLVFSVDGDTSYDISGMYAVTDADADAGASGRVILSAFLVDATTGVSLMLSDNVSRATANASFVLGGTGGDESSVFLGSLTGTLTAGHRYGFGFLTRTETFGGDDAGASATGNITLTIGARDAQVSTVPEPGTLPLLALAAVCLGALSRKSLGRATR